MNTNPIPVVTNRARLRYTNLFFRRGRRADILSRINQASFYELNRLILARSLESSSLKPRSFLLKALDERIDHWNRASQILKELDVCKTSHATVAQVLECARYAMYFLWLEPDYRSAKPIEKEAFLQRLQGLHPTDHILAYTSNLTLYCGGKETPLKRFDANEPSGEES